MKHRGESVKRKRVRKFFVVLLVLVLALGLGYLSFMNALRIRRNMLLTSAAHATQTTSAATSGAQNALLSGDKSEAEAIPIDFGALQKVNADIYAWLQITGTNIAQPIVQHPTDDSYYLKYTIDGVRWGDGAIYTELCNAKDFSDINTVLYGHNMTDDTMFGGLSAYLAPDYLAQHRELVVYTPTQKRTYRIFAAVVYDDTYIPFVYNPTKVESCQEFIDSLSQTGDENSQVLEQITVTENTRLLTLSTCYMGYSRPENRYLVLAVLDE